LLQQLRQRTRRALDSARQFARVMREGPLPDAEPPSYRSWLAQHAPRAGELKRQAAASRTLAWQPAIDLVVFRRPGDEMAFAATMASLRAQTYPRFTVVTSDAQADARGELVGFLESGDRLAAHALFSVASCGAPDADLYYCDEDSIEGRRRVRPVFKPAWSPDALLSRDYVGGLALIRRHVLDRAGGLRPAGGAEQHDLLLRALPDLRKVHHLADVLFQRRCDFTRADAEMRRGVIADHVRRAWGPGYRVSSSGEPEIFYEPAQPARVALIMPMRDKVELSRAFIDSISRHPSHAVAELIVVDNCSSEPATHAFLADLAASGRAKIVRYPNQRFNWSEANNLGAAATAAEYLFFVNNDMEVLTDGWLDAMLAFASRPEIGVVGAQLFFPDGTLQHYGVVMGMTGYAGHLLAGTGPAAWTFCGPTDIVRNCTAVTGACMMMRRKLFDDLGGFDQRFILCGSDVEICLRAIEAGYRNVVTPHARLTHHESKTRDPRAIPKSDFQRSFEAYEPYLRDGDPYYNPQLSLKTPLPVPRLEPEDMLAFARGFI
jgi:GT2 family glycosyltransferase